MSDQLNQPQPTPDLAPQQPAGPPALFGASKPAETGGTPVVAWAIAGVVVLLVVGILLIVGNKKSSGPGNTILPLAAYSANLPLSKLAMSESENISGGKYTYIDGHIANTGTQTVTGVTVQVIFANEVALPPQVETQRLALIRTHEPYIDTQQLSASPLKPGDDREFRLTFETIPSNWNGQMPEVHITSAETR